MNTNSFSRWALRRKLHVRHRTTAWLIIGVISLSIGLPGVVYSQDGKPTGTEAVGNSQSSLADQTLEINIDVRPFPRQFTQEGTTFSIYQPQYDQWKGNQLDGRFVMAVKTGTKKNKEGKEEDEMTYGVVWFSARSQVDKAARAVVLTEMNFTRSNFPTAPDRGAHYLSLVEKQIPKSGTLTVSLDHLESALAIGAVDSSTKSIQVSNTPPDIIFTTEPAILILIQGQPALRSTGHGRVERIINTQALLLKEHGAFYTYFANHWAKADSLDGPWSPEQKVNHALEESMTDAVNEKLVNTLDKPPQDLQQILDQGKLPGIYVRSTPSELITTTGEPQFADIEGTQLSYIENTGADVFVDAAANHAWYVLISGRWFTATGSKGPWSYVAADQLPEDFSKIPPDSAKSAALASIPGTPEAKESLIANSIPQTATVSSSQAELTVHYDGQPQLNAIDGTQLEYVKNTAVPVIRVSSGEFYAVDKGIWFTATSTEGPWTVATSVPAEIYSIPASSPLHYVTYVQVYGTHEDDVYVGYTPGYYGTVVSNDVVVYGTGYPCHPWIGTYWYGCPLTYGMGAYFGWNPWVGWTFGLGWGWYAGWFGAYSPWWGPWAGGLYPYGWWGGGAAAWNVYGHWGDNVVRGTAGAWANPWTGNYGRAARGGFYNEATGARGVGRAGINTNIYTGTTRAGAQGIKYNPETGRVTAGERTAAANPYSGQAGTQGRGTSVNARTGQVTQHAGAAGADREGAAGAGTFRTTGSEGDARGVGGFHYNADTGALNHGGVVQANGNLYAGHDGNVYQHSDSGWNQLGGDSRSGDFSDQLHGLDNDRFASERGDDRMSGEFGGDRFGGGMGGFNRGMGGFRGGLGGFGGGFGGFRGGFRR